MSLPLDYEQKQIEPQYHWIESLFNLHSLQESRQKHSLQASS